MAHKYKIENVGFGPRITGRQTAFALLDRAKKAAQTAANVSGSMVGVYEDGKQVAVFSDRSESAREQ